MGEQTSHPDSLRGVFEGLPFQEVATRRRRLENLKGRGAGRGDLRWALSSSEFYGSWRGRSAGHRAPKRTYDLPFPSRDPVGPRILPIASLCRRRSLSLFGGLPERLRSLLGLSCPLSQSLHTQPQRCCLLVHSLHDTSPHCRQDSPVPRKLGTSLPSLPTPLQLLNGRLAVCTL